MTARITGVALRRRLGPDSLDEEGDVTGSDAVGYGLLLSGLLLLVLLRLVGRRLAQLVSRKLGDQLRAWAERLTPVPEVDQDALDLARAVRRERLLDDIHRLQVRIATDASKSAVRQIGNRLAYRQVLADLRETPDPWLAVPAGGGAQPWNVLVLPTSARSRSAGSYAQQPPQVETLEIGWRR